MAQFTVLTAAEQLAAHLREEMQRGRWKDLMPGCDRLMKELGVGRDTINEALKQLEREGFLASQGRRRQRRIVRLPTPASTKPLRVKILHYEQADRYSQHNLSILAELQNKGYAADFARRSLQDLGMQAGRVSEFVAKTPADAWIIEAGSREILEWFSRYHLPAMAMFGIFTGLPLAAVSLRKTPAMRIALQRLVDLGHRRIVLLTREERRKPQPGLFERNYLEELATLGVKPGSYNLPGWEDSAQGLQRCLDELFAYTPPTAILIDNLQLFTPVEQYLARRKIVVPGQVSLIVNDSHVLFDWSKPMISQLSGDYNKVVKRVCRWVENVAKGKADHRQAFVDAEFIEGGTIGSV